MGDYDWEIKEYLGEIKQALRELVTVMKDIRDKMPPLEGDYERD